jgi:hypothetical protein
MNSTIDNVWKHAVTALLLVSCPFSLGWVHKLDLRDTRNFYTAVKIKDAREVFTAGFSDMRPQKLTVGKIGKLRFISNIPVRRALGDRVASRLATKGFNVKDVSIGLQASRISSLLSENKVERLVTGEIYRLSFSGMVQGSGDISGKNVFSVTIYDMSGEIAFEKYFFVSAGGVLADTPLAGAEALMEELLSAGVDSVFADTDFCSVMGIAVSPGSPNYDATLSDKMNAFLDEYVSGKIDAKEFERSREGLIDSF